jgi:hypothetical protein
VGTGLSTRSRKFFVPTFSGTAGSVRFSDKVQIDQYDMQYVSLSDMDGDGKSDMVGITDGQVWVYRNKSTSGALTTSSFEARVGYSTDGSNRGLVIGDLNGDGKPELIVWRGSGEVSIFRNESVQGTTPSMSFGTRVIFSVGGDPNHVSMSDLDNDGKPDLIVTNQSANTLTILRNTSTSGTISFATGITVSTGLGPRITGVGDLDGDGRADIALLVGTTVSLLRNTTSAVGSISFSTGYDIPLTGMDPSYIDLADIDVDGKPDLVLSHSSSLLSVYRNMVSSSGSFGSGSFPTRLDFSTGISNNTRFSVGDIDGDGLPDIALSRQDGGSGNPARLSVPLLRNTTSSGTINFADVVTLAITEDKPGWVTIGDLDGDGVSDLAVGCTQGGRLYVLRNANLDPLVVPPPVVESFTPVKGASGTSVTITGQRFSATTSQNVVWFGSVRGTVMSSSTTSLSVTVPWIWA